MEKKKLCMKMFIIFASFFMLIILCNSNVFAAENNYTFHDLYFDKDVTIKNFEPISEDYKYYFVLCSDRGSSSSGGYNKCVFYQIAFSTAPFVYHKEESSGNGDSAVFSTEGSSYSYLLQNYDVRFNSSYNLKDESYSKPGVWFTTLSVPTNIERICLSNHDIVDKVTGETVFQKAKEPGQLTTIVQSMDFLAVIKEVLGILPMILVVLIGLLSLRKVIQLMLKMLHQA